MNVDYVLHAGHPTADDRTSAEECSQQRPNSGAMHCSLTVNQPALVRPAAGCLSQLQRRVRGTNNAIIVSDVRRGGSTITFTLAADAHGHQPKAAQLRGALMILRRALEGHWRDQCNRHVIRSKTTWTITS